MQLASEITTVRVHDKSVDGDLAGWGQRLWGGSALDATRVPASVAIDAWDKPSALCEMQGCAAVNAGQALPSRPVRLAVVSVLP